nr:MAG TPA: hypothetical protein [Caudoviricetes sp.]
MVVNHSRCAKTPAQYHYWGQTISRSVNEYRPSAFGELNNCPLLYSL